MTRGFVICLLAVLVLQKASSLEDKSQLTDPVLTPLIRDIRTLSDADMALSFTKKMEDELKARKRDHRKDQILYGYEDQLVITVLQVNKYITKQSQFEGEVEEWERYHRKFLAHLANLTETLASYLEYKNSVQQTTQAAAEYPLNVEVK